MKNDWPNIFNGDKQLQRKEHLELGLEKPVERAFRDKTGGKAFKRRVKPVEM